MANRVYNEHKQKALLIDHVFEHEQRNKCKCKNCITNTIVTEGDKTLSEGKHTM